MVKTYYEMEQRGLFYIKNSIKETFLLLCKRVKAGSKGPKMCLFDVSFYFFMFSK
jgi:hypothetical protein